MLTMTFLSSVSLLSRSLVYLDGGKLFDLVDRGTGKFIFR